MIRPLVAILMLAAVLVLIAFAACIYSQPQGYALGWLRAGSYPDGSASLRSNLTFDAATFDHWQARGRRWIERSPEGDHSKNRVGAIPTSATTDLPNMKRRQTPCSSAS